MHLERFTIVLLIGVGLINFIPVLGVFSAQRLQSLYGLGELDAQLTLLMRHRALLFGLLGAVILASALIPSLRWVAYPLALISMIGFIVLAPPVAQLGDPLRAVIRADWLGIALCLLALATDVWRCYGRP